jgi:RNA methyltransferase, TrmH family
MEYDISSPSNPRIKRLVGLRDRKHRDAEQIFPVEEVRIIDRALASGHIPSEVFWCPDLLPRPNIDGVPLTSVSQVALAKACYRSSPEGSIALFAYLPATLDSIGQSAKELVVVAEGLEKPGNLGAVLRIADAAGATGVVVVDDNADPFNPNVVRTSTGSIFTVPVAVASLSETARWLVERGVTSVAGMAGASKLMWDVDLDVPLAIWIGAEASGLSQEAIGLADHLVAIPMAGVADSLNASVSAGILVFEAVRQRRHNQPE